MRTTAHIIVIALAASSAAAQPLKAKVDAVGSGTVRFSYAAAEGVCGNGRGNISIRQNGRGTTSYGEGRRGREWEDECEPGPVRIAVDVSRGTVTSLRSYVGGRWRGTSDTDLGTVSASDASEYLLTLAESGRNEVAKDAIFPAMIAEGASPWRRLLAIAKDQRRPDEVRKSAIFWVGQGAAEAATVGLQEIVDDPNGDREVRKSAIFSISQRPHDESVPALIRIARSHRDPELRRTAIFWLGQSHDPRAVAYFEEVLISK